MTETAGIVINLEEWITENRKFFLPPVCNKMMHSAGQMKSFYVGGPNQRKDFHIECGEELFYQRTGDMVLKVVEKGVHKDIKIKEGQMFLLPCCTAHSPQRFDNTVGLVLERERAKQELDGLRYFIEENDKLTTESLFEEWFHCVDLGSQLGPVIKRFFASEQYKTGQPLPGTIPDNPPVKLDFSITMQDPFDFGDWLKENKAEIDKTGYKQVFPGEHQFQVFVYGAGNKSDKSAHAETWIWQLEGNSEVSFGSKTAKLAKKDDTILIPVGEKFTVAQKEGSYAFVCYQDPSKSKTWTK